MAEINKTCIHCNIEFTISTEEMSMYEKVGIVLPTLCFFCRVKLHLSFWLYGKFRKGKSDLSGENLITILPENTRYPIYTLTEWYSDSWDAMDYGQKYNKDEIFFDQLKRLQEKVPRPHQNAANNKGCEWSDDVWNSKNCYLSRSMEECEDLFYSYRNIKVKNSIDMIVCFNSERCFDCSNCDHCYKLFYSKNSRDCVDSYFLFDCRNCQDCFMCWNLRGKSYCIENIQYTKEEYQQKLKSIKFDSYNFISDLKNKFVEIIKNKVIHRENFNLKTHNSTGNNLLNTKNCYNCHTISDSEDSFNLIRGMKVDSSIDLCGCWYGELSGNNIGCVNIYNLKYSSWSSSRNSEYLDLCIECENCFGCIGLKKKKYCILNKQYTKEGYEELKTMIISDMKKTPLRQGYEGQGGEYGKFLPYEMSLGPFNFSTSFLYFPETAKEDILKLGGYWQDLDESHIQGLSTDLLPDSIHEVSDDISSQALICPETGWRFNIAPNELIFYKQNNIPLPRYHFDVRIKNNFKYMSSLKSYPNKCFYCQKEIEVYYPPDWGYKNIACQNCYQQNLN
jgi:hypothetical protein